MFGNVGQGARGIRQSASAVRAFRQHALQMPGLELPLTLALEEAGELDVALELVNGLVREDKNNYQPYLYLGSILAALGKHDEAARTYGIAVHLNPQLRDLAQRPDGPQFVRKRVAKCVQTVRTDAGRLWPRVVCQSGGASRC